MYPDDPTRLRHIRDAINEAIGFIKGKQRRDLDADRQLYLSLCKEIEIIGEAASRITTAKKKAYPEIPWSQMVGMRNWLIHGYFMVSKDTLWSTITNELPKLKESLKTVSEGRKTRKKNSKSLLVKTLVKGA